MGVKRMSGPIDDAVVSLSPQTAGSKSPKALLVLNTIGTTARV